MSPLVGCPGPGGLLFGGAFVRGVFRPGALLAGGTFGRGDFLSGTAFVQGGGLMSGGLMPVPPNFNAYAHHLGFLCLAS